ncbi:hypothetical protein ES707_10029 [subsurface metagenome]|jgi:hypothetical protein
METLSKIGGDGAIQFIAESGQHLSEATVVGSHGEATHQVLGWLGSLGLLGADGLEAIGHRSTVLPGTPALSVDLPPKNRSR